MAASPKMTLQTKTVLQLALQDPGREWYGLQMIEATGLPPGTIYPIIARLERHGWLESRWEDPAEHEAAGRPRRRYYRFTSDGAERARLALAPDRGPGGALRSRCTRRRAPTGRGRWRDEIDRGPARRDARAAEADRPLL